MNVLQAVGPAVLELVGILNAQEWLEHVNLGADFSLGQRIVVGVGTAYSSDNTTIGTDCSHSKATSYVGVIYWAY